MDPIKKAEAFADYAHENHHTDNVFLLYYVNNLLYGGNVGAPYADVPCGISSYPVSPQEIANILVHEYRVKERDVPLFVCDARAARLIGDKTSTDTQSFRRAGMDGSFLKIAVHEYLYPEDGRRIRHQLETIVHKGKEMHDLPGSLILFGEDPVLMTNYIIDLDLIHTNYVPGDIRLFRAEAGMEDLLNGCAAANVPLLCHKNSLELLAGRRPTHVEKHYALLGNEDDYAEAYLVHD